MEDTRIAVEVEAEDTQEVTIATKHRNAHGHGGTILFDTISKSSKFVHVHDNS